MENPFPSIYFKKYVGRLKIDPTALSIETTASNPTLIASSAGMVIFNSSNNGAEHKQINSRPPLSISSFSWTQALRNRNTAERINLSCCVFRFNSHFILLLNPAEANPSMDYYPISNQQLPLPSVRNGSIIRHPQALE